MNGWVLAGGRSRRFGSDKALHRVDGVPMAERVARVLAEAGLVVAVLGREPRGLAVPEVIEPDGPRHPLWGVAFALERGDGFFAPCDLVDLRVDAVRALLEARAVAVGLPLLGVIPADRATRARALALEGAPARALVADLPRRDVGVFRNLNRPEA